MIDAANRILQVSAQDPGTFTFDLEITKTLSAQYAAFIGSTQIIELLPKVVQVANLELSDFVESPVEFQAPIEYKVLMNTESEAGINGNLTYSNVVRFGQFINNHGSEVSSNGDPM